MSDDEREYLQRARAFLRDAFTPDPDALKKYFGASTPETDAILNAYVGMDTTDGPAFPCNAQSDAEAVTQLVGRKTYEA